MSTVITEHDLTVIADQLTDSMGFMFPLMCGFSLALYMLLVYLLSKMIIEKNAQSISMLKILGYTPREISSLYNSATAIAVGVSLIVTIPISALIMKWLFYYYMHEMSGWVSFYIAPWICRQCSASARRHISSFILYKQNALERSPWRRH